MRILTAFFSLLFPVIACSQLQKIYLYPKAASSEKQSKFIDSLHFVPLEIKDGIQLSTYNNMEVTNDYFLIIDYPVKTVLLYSKAGRFVKKIKYKKLGENFYPSYDKNKNQIVFFGNNKNYTLTPRDQIKIRLDWENPRNKKYFKKYIIDLNDTAFTFQRAATDETDIIRAHSFYQQYYAQGDVGTSPLYKDSLEYELKIYENKKLTKKYFPYNRINEPRFLFAEDFVSISPSGNPAVHFISRPYCDTIYKMVKDSLFPAYQLVLPMENSLPATFFKKPFNNKTDRENFARNNGWMLHEVYNFYETPSLFYFNVRYLSNFESYVYQRQGNITFKAKNIKPDSSQFNVQLLADYGLLRKGDRFYKAQKAGDLLTYFEEHSSAEVPKELVEWIKSKPPASTPVIIEFTFKNPQ